MYSISVCKGRSSLGVPFPLPGSLFIFIHLGEPTSHGSTFQAQIAIRPKKGVSFLLFPPTQPPQSCGQTVIENGEIKMQAELSKLNSRSILMPTLNRNEEKNVQGGKKPNSLTSVLELKSDVL